MLLSAGLVPPPIVGKFELLPGLAGSGLLAVPESVAVSLSVLPRTHGSAEQLADVLSVGVFGVMVKHSLFPLSSWGSTPALFDAASGSKWACQQYIPVPKDDVSNTEPEV